MRKNLIIILLGVFFTMVFASSAQAAIVGIDVSKWQGTIDWDTASQSASFAIIKAGGSDAGLYTDSEFERNQSEARRVGIARGYYYFGGSGDPVAEAEHFASITGPLEPGEVVALDYEIDHPEGVDYVQKFLERTEQLLGVKPMLYTNMNRVWGLDWRNAVANGNALWGACYDNNPLAAPAQPGAWPGLTVKQYTSKGIVPGIGKLVDLDYFAGSIEEFKAIGWPPPVTVSASASVYETDPEKRPYAQRAGGLYDHENQKPRNRNDLGGDHIDVDSVDRVDGAATDGGATDSAATDSAATTTAGQAQAGGYTPVDNSAANQSQSGQSAMSGSGQSGSTPGTDPVAARKIAFERIVEGARLLRSLFD